MPPRSVSGNLSEQIQYDDDALDPRPHLALGSRADVVAPRSFQSRALADPSRLVVNRPMWAWEWRCCGWLWELIPSRRFLEAQTVRPKCPTCGKKPEHRWFQVPR
jgi:hypothetical protein